MGEVLDRDLSIYIDKVKGYLKSYQSRLIAFRIHLKYQKDNDYTASSKQGKMSKAIDGNCA